VCGSDKQETQLFGFMKFNFCFFCPCICARITAVSYDYHNPCNYRYLDYGGGDH